MNKAIILGRLGAKPTLRYTNSGTAVASFSVATTKKWKDNNGDQQSKTQWHEIIVWAKLAELCEQYLDKGHQCLVEGEIETRSYDDKDGVTKYKTEIIASMVQFLGGGNNDNG